MFCGWGREVRRGRGMRWVVRSVGRPPFSPTATTTTIGSGYFSSIKRLKNISREKTEAQAAAHGKKIEEGRRKSPEATTSTAHLDPINHTHHQSSIHPRITPTLSTPQNPPSRAADNTLPSDMSTTESGLALQREHTHTRARAGWDVSSKQDFSPDLHRGL